VSSAPRPAGSAFPCVSFESGMVLDECGAQEFAVDVGVDFGGGDGFVAEHFLDGPEVGTAFDEMGGERVAEGMRGDGFFDAGFFSELFDEHEDINPGKRSAIAVQE